MVATCRLLLVVVKVDKLLEVSLAKDVLVRGAGCLTPGHPVLYLYYFFILRLPVPGFLWFLIRLHCLMEYIIGRLCQLIDYN